MIKLHHVNLCSDRVPALDSFYRTVLGLQSVPELEKDRITDGYGAPTAFVTDGNLQLHLSTYDFDLGDRLGHQVNPVDHGHIAFRTDDIDEVKQRLTAAGVLISDYGVWGMKGWHQMFFRDPAGNVVEVHQIVDDQT